MQNSNIKILQEADAFTLVIDGCNYRFSHYFDESDYEALIEALHHITSDTINIELEEGY